MNDAHLFPRERSIDLSRLNEAERRVLRMLAEGHTAKSVANALGSTPAAVNERLREARRKTGVGSSRELARMLKAQENRDKQIGVGRQSTLATDPQELGGGLIRSDWKGPVAMTLALFTVLGAAALVAQQAPSSRDDIEPLIGAPVQRFTDPADFHARVRTEKRDPDWAPRMELAIRARVLQIPLVGKDGNVLRVTCGRTLCEIAGTIIAPASQREREDQNSQFSRTIKDLQVPPLPDDLAKIGLKSESGSFLSGKGPPDHSVFLLYYSRARS